MAPKVISERLTISLMVNCLALAINCITIFIIVLSDSYVNLKLPSFHSLMLGIGISIISIILYLLPDVSLKILKDILLL